MTLSRREEDESRRRASLYSRTGGRLVLVFKTKQKLVLVFKTKQKMVSVSNTKNSQGSVTAFALLPSLPKRATSPFNYARVRKVDQFIRDHLCWQ